MEIQEEAEDEKKFIITEEKLPWEGYKNWQPLRNANLVEHKNNNSGDFFECENQHIKWLEYISTPKKNKLEGIQDRISKKKNNTKEEKEYFWITQNKKIFPSLQAHFARQYQISTQNEDWIENKNKNGNGNTNHEYLSNEEEFQDKYLNEERRK
ncbi:hypothetical protein O181_002992 [Austropuccinia psidii MF-1]|uniref:Uncharacterized protein n=1 Tax=Austropuccinia psidii MF-1 TaxID=1389203 RepID=A0A9Q3BDV3_9BASI|nr:hypothetical protein [Austropuccinia psidii MF-1]